MAPADTSGSSPSYEVLAIRYGTLTASRKALYANYEVYDQPDGPMQLDYFFWIARDGERTVVVDTGFSSEVGRRRGREVLCEPRRALERLGIDPLSVTDVVITHFHYDHIGNVDLFPAARLVASAREYGFWTGRYGRRPVPAAPVERSEVEVLERAEAEGRLVLTSEDYAGIPGVELLDLGGHTPGQLGLVVPTNGSRVVLASDAAHSYEEFQDDMPFHVYSDIEGMYRGFDVLRNLAAAPDTVVVPGHDPEVMQRFAPFSDDTADLAVAIS